MALVSITNSRGQSIDSIIAPDGTVLFKLGVGQKTIAGQTDLGSWQGVATHEDGATFVASDGVVVLAGKDGTTVRPVLVDASGQLIALLRPSGGNVTNRSGSITAGGTSQQLMASNLTRKYLFIENLDTAEDLWIDFTSAAVVDQPSIKIHPGGAFVMEGSYVSTEAINVIAATTGHKFTAKEA